VVAVARGKGKPVDSSELLDLAQALLAESSFAFEGVQHNPFQQISQAQIFEFGDRLQNLEEVLLHTDAGLDALNEDLS